jgi:hypothetical protein
MGCRGLSCRSGRIGSLRPCRIEKQSYQGAEDGCNEEPLCPFIWSALQL